jgi:hypothetical protein
MSEGISFAGNGAGDISVTPGSTVPDSPAKSSEKAIEFAGNGGADVSHAPESANLEGKGPDSGKGSIEFAGDTNG